jgi:hypothetical protein
MPCSITTEPPTDTHSPTHRSHPDDLVAHDAKQAPVMRRAIGGGALHRSIKPADEPADLLDDDLPTLLDVLGCLNPLEPSGEGL